MLTFKCLSLNLNDEAKCDFVANESTCFKSEGFYFTMHFLLAETLKVDDFRWQTVSDGVVSI